MKSELAGILNDDAFETAENPLRRRLFSAGDQASRTRLYVEQFDQAAPTTGGRAIRDDRYKLIRFNTGADEFHDFLTDPSETTNLLASGIANMSASHQAYYYRLRFNLGRYTTTAAAAPLGHSVDTNGFFLTVPQNPAVTQTMWQSTDLDFWGPVSEATHSASQGNAHLQRSPAASGKMLLQRSDGVDVSERL